MTSVLVDTSVWRRYFAGSAGAENSRILGELLDFDGGVLRHSAVLGELVLGGLSSREEALFLRLPPAPDVHSSELLAFVRARKLARKGIGWTDCHLLASALIAGAMLWSLDTKLSAAAASCRVQFDGQLAP
jgi:predicted nucleic acid-binding protein